MVPVECGFERRPVWVRVAPVLKVEGGVPLAAGEHLPAWRLQPIGEVNTRWDLLPAVDFVSCVLSEEGVAGLQRHALVGASVGGRGAGVGSRGRSGRARRRGRGRGWSAGGAGEKGLAAGLAQVDRVTFSTLKPTFSVVRE